MIKIEFRKPAIAAVTASCLVACAPMPDTVVFGQAQTVGISIGQSQGAPAPELVVGYKDANVALLPTAVRDENGKPEIIGGTTTGNSSFKETFSVFGQFEVSAEGSGKVGLGKFFATGLAAQKLSAGFACAASGGDDKSHCHENSPTTGTTKPVTTDN